MEKTNYIPQQRTAWYNTVIKHAAIRTNRKHARWTKEALTLNTTTEDGEEVLNLLPSESAERAFQDSELLMALETLPERERLIIESIYKRGDTQREIATVLHVSQAKVSKLHRAALNRLMRTMENEMYS